MHSPSGHCDVFCYALQLMINAQNVTFNNVHLTEMDEELYKYKMEREQNRNRVASTWKEAETSVENVERLKKEKQDLQEIIRMKDKELSCFRRLLRNFHIVQRDKEELKDIIKTRTSELKEAKASLEEKEKQLKKYKLENQRLKKKIDDLVQDLQSYDDKIIQLERKKVKLIEAEKKKVRVFHTVYKLHNSNSKAKDSP